jgi:tripartite-type tricarboxylate transporter receptor subunit TctC
MNRLLLRVLAGALFAACLGPVHAQDYPNRSVRLVVPLAPAGAADILGRLLAERLGAAWGQSVVVDNKPGASGHVGAQIVARSPGDGYTLMVGTIGIHAAHGSYRKLAYDPARELQPILILGEAPNIVVVPAASPYKTFGDFLADARANPGKISYATAGPGSSVHMVTALFEMAAGVRMNHIPYKGSGPALTDLVGGQVQVMFDNMSSSMAQIKAGKLRALAVTTARRDPRFPDVPALAEVGVPGYGGTSWFTIAAPSTLPAVMVDKINKDLQKILASPEVVARYDALGMNYTPNTPTEAAAFFRSETVKWNRVIEATRL